MRLSKNKSGGELQLNMTPMIDVVFLLLIFFMTVSQVSAVNKEILNLPKQKGSSDQTEGTVIINIDAEGRIRVMGELLTVAQIAVLVDGEIKRQGNEPLNVKVVLRIAENAKVHNLNELVRMLHKLNISRVLHRVESPTP